MSNARAGKRTDDDVDRLEDEVADLRASRRRIAAAADADRRAIERELHDGVQQHLAAIALDLQRLARVADGDPTAARALVAEMRGIVQEAFDETVRLATRIYPQLLDGRGLAGALRSAAGGVGVTAAVDIPAETSYTPEITAALYWAWADALCSATAGSEATIKVVNSDAGLAFDMFTAGRAADPCLERLRDRIQALDGRVGLENLRAGGSRIQGWLPLRR